MKFKDCSIKGVRRNGSDSLCFRVECKSGDYEKDEYDILHNKEVDGITSDIEVKTAICSTPPTTQMVDQGTGEILN